MAQWLERHLILLGMEVAGSNPARRVKPIWLSTNFACLRLTKEVIIDISDVGDSCVGMLHG